MFTAMMHWMRDNGVLPKVSDTERQALEAGDVWIDGDFFAGNPDFRAILEQPYHRLSDAEQRFVDGPVEELCRSVDAEEIARTRRVPERAMRFMRENCFFGINVPEAYGGLGFSMLGKAAVLHKLTSHSSVLATLVGIPASVGGAVLIDNHGTQAQKDFYLPRMARGDIIPCFGLTEPTAGSDAASLTAEAQVFKDDDGEARLRLNFRKRYITLAPIADLVALAVRVVDPDNLLGKGEDAGLTVVLVPTDTPGVETGDRHLPAGDPFINGPIVGRDVELPVDQVIGATEGVGVGWKWLMQELAGGRVMSLPAGAVAGMKSSAAGAGAFSMVRRQFGLPIGHMEGVEDKIGKIAALTYVFDGFRIFSCSAVDRGIEPPVASAAMKYTSSDTCRELLTDGVDVFAGAAIMQGPNNVLSRAQYSANVGVTVEGANIMTRTLIVFGQGATRCHPYTQKLLHAVEDADVRAFRNSLFGWIGQIGASLGRTLVRGLTRGWTVRTPNAAPSTKKYYRRLGWAASRFALMTNLALLFLGGKLKIRGNLTGRYADALAWMLLATGTLRRFEAEGRRAEDLPLVHYGVQHSLAEVQSAFIDIYRNFDGPLGWLLRTVGVAWLRLNPLGAAPRDGERRAAARTIQAHGEQYRRLAENIYLPDEDVPGMGRLLHAFRLTTETQPIVDKIKAAQRAGRLDRCAPEEAVAAAAESGEITSSEAEQLQAAHAARLAACEVDVFTPEAFYADAVEPAQEQTFSRVS